MSMVKRADFYWCKYALKGFYVNGTVKEKFWSLLFYIIDDCGGEFNTNVSNQ